MSITPWGISAVFATLTCLPASASALCLHPDGATSMVPVGDVNSSGSINVADAMCVVLESLAVLGDPGGAPAGCLKGRPRQVADIDCDGTANAGDAQLAVHLAIFEALPAAVDTNGDGCPNLCLAAPAVHACDPAPADTTPLNTQAEADYNCTALLQAGYVQTGAYWIDPNGGATDDAFVAYCDMHTDGGGWTLITNVVGSLYSYNTSADLTANFIFPEDVSATLGPISEEIRYQCKKWDSDVYIDVATSHEMWLARPYSYGDACVKGFNWNPGIDHFTPLGCNNFAYDTTGISVGCAGRAGYLLDVYPIGFGYTQWMINDIYPSGNPAGGWSGTYSGLCAGASYADYHRIYYRGLAPDCSAKQCGPDGIGGSCGDCPPGEGCTAGFLCAPPDCDGRVCGPDGIGGSCGTCQPSAECTIDGQCFVPACAGKECGPDGIGGVCGTCAPGEGCSEAGLCAVPNCTNRMCGSDGAGGSCGTCSVGEVCSGTGQCVVPVVAAAHWRVRFFDWYPTGSIDRYSIGEIAMVDAGAAPLSPIAVTNAGAALTNGVSCTVNDGVFPSGIVYETVFSFAAPVSVRKIMISHTHANNLSKTWKSFSLHTGPSTSGPWTEAMTFVDVPQTAYSARSWYDVWTGETIYTGGLNSEPNPPSPCQ